MQPLVTLVVPVLGDTDALAALLARLPHDPRLELIVVDGGDDPAVEALARPPARLVRSGPGRGRQMNAGAAVAAGRWLLFLHADSTLPEGWLDLFEKHAGAAVGGWFRLALDDSRWQARLIERGVAWRVRLLRLPYGDQGIFVRKTVFDALGGYRELPLMEDVEFVRRLVHAGRTIELPLALTTSARRWRRDGWLHRSARNVALVSLYFAGVSPARLARWYSR